MATAPTEMYTLSLHDALPISHVLGLRDAGGWRRADDRDRVRVPDGAEHGDGEVAHGVGAGNRGQRDRKSTRLNSSHQIISYAVFCLKKKKRTRSGSGRGI